jgi:hypothetical protein
LVFFLHLMGLWSLRWAFSNFKLAPKLFLEHVERLQSTRPPWLQAERRRQIKVISFGCPPNYFPHKHIKLETTLNGGKNTKL